MRKALFAVLAGLLATSPALGQTVSQSRAAGNVGAAVVVVPSTGRAQTSDTTSEAQAVVITDPTGGSATTGASGNAAVAFRQTCTTSAVQMASNTLSNGIVIKALSTNGGTAYIGPAGVTTSTGYPLSAGEPISYGVANTNQLYLICSDTTSVIAATGN